MVIPDVTFELAKRNEDMYLFSPHDVEKVYGLPFSEISVTEKYAEMVDDKRIRKKKITPAPSSRRWPRSSSKAAIPTSCSRTR